MKEEDPILISHKKLFEKIMPFEKLPSECKVLVFEGIAFRRELTKESDRGCALLAAAHLDYMLESVLRKKMIGSKNHLDSLFNFNGPVGTFSGRILLAHSIGLLSKMQLYDIQIIRKIRNEFGHSPSIIDFENDKIKSLCSQLKLIGRENCIKARSQFITSVFFILGSLDVLLIKEEKFVICEEVNVERTKDGVTKIMDIIENILKEKD